MALDYSQWGNLVSYAFGDVFNCSFTKSEQPDNLTPLEISLFSNATPSRSTKSTPPRFNFSAQPSAKILSQVLHASPIHGPTSRPSNRSVTLRLTDLTWEISDTK